LISQSLVANLFFATLFPLSPLYFTLWFFNLNLWKPSDETRRSSQILPILFTALWHILTLTTGSE
jgi:hypothetical protein